MEELGGVVVEQPSSALTQGRMIACVSVCGGAGHTALTMDLARELGSKGPVAIVNVEGSVIDEWSRIKPDGISLIRQEKSGADEELIQRLRRDFSFGLVHVRLSLEPVSKKFIDASDLILIPLTPDLGSLLKVKDAVTVLDSWLIPRAHVVGILNRVKESSNPEISKGLSGLGIKIMWILPDDPQFHWQVWKEGRSGPRALAKSCYAEGIRGLAEALMSNPSLYRVNGHAANGHGPTTSRPDWIGVIESFRQRLTKTLEERHRESGGNASPINPSAVEAILKQLMAEDASLTGLGLSGDDREKLFEQVLHRVIGLGPVHELLGDDTISEIMVRGTNAIWIERRGQLELVEQRFGDLDELSCVIERIVTPLGRRVDASVPICDARLPDGSRVNIVIPPVALNGPEITIRKFRKQHFSLQDLAQTGALSQEMVEFLKRCVEGHQSILVSGGTGSGKTTLLNALSGFIGSRERIVTIEDAAELRLQQEHVVRLESRPPNLEGAGAITIRQLLINALRMRPDRIIIGECRGAEALDLLQALNTGHKGSLTTLHANSPREALSRLEVLSLMAGIELPLRAIREQICGGVDVIVQVSRLSDGSRKVMSITEVTGMEGDVITLAELYAFKGGRSMNGEDFEASGLKPQFIVET